ncbi:MAG: hypothetical protein M1819_003655 [Sarea resinae]|nr:MAG: hypothetical protein M1819_003655 [Sarea resinae]
MAFTPEQAKVDTPTGNRATERRWTGEQALDSLRRSLESLLSTATKRHPACPQITRQSISPADKPVIGEKDSNVGRFRHRADTVLYLAYGSNLAAETFKGRRGIKPLSQCNVVVPELTLTFDLPGIPYIEPCFANSSYRVQDPALAHGHSDSEKGPLMVDWRQDYHKDRWKKGMVGVVYEVTKEDYARIIATEGGGTAYQDVLVDCYPLSGAAEVPQKPTSSSFKAHTLYSPPSDGAFQRPDPSYAQASARYLKLITDGADENGIPQEYRDYLHQIRPYTITTTRQRIGQAIFVAAWAPFFALILLLNRLLADKSGRSPAWLMAFTAHVFSAAWANYDSTFKPIFGEGERTIYKGGDRSQSISRWSLSKRSKGHRDRYDESGAAV